ncbi:MAG: replication initiator protein WhiP [Acidilobaceae archaeon]|nr:replication initiator protein WhiP [Acidilobaceae archaeon]MDW7974079.1 replication initiator protein WhiP [Sulfolobales archaeon]
MLDSIRERARRGGPRSRTVDAILLLLLSRPMRSGEIAGLLEKSSQYVSSYLSYWKARGYVEYEAGLWRLTPKGEAYAREIYERETREEDEYLAVAHKVLTSRIKAAKKDKRLEQGRGKSGGVLSFIAEQKGKESNKLQERVSISTCVLNSIKDHVSEGELEVVMSLFSHYARWGTTYMYVDQLQERMGADFTWLMKALRDLQSKGLVYLYTDPRLGIRVGFSKSLKAEIERCQQ